MLNEVLTMVGTPAHDSILSGLPWKEMGMERAGRPVGERSGEKARDQQGALHNGVEPCVEEGDARIGQADDAEQDPGHFVRSEESATGHTLSPQNRQA